MYLDYSKKLDKAGEKILAKFYRNVANIPKDAIYKIRKDRPNWLKKESV